MSNENNNLSGHPYHDYFQGSYLHSPTSGHNSQHLYIGSNSHQTQIYPYPDYSSGHHYTMNNNSSILLPNRNSTVSFEDSGYDSTLSSIDRQTSFVHTTPDQQQQTFNNNSSYQSQRSFLEPLVYSPTANCTEIDEEDDLYEESLYSQKSETQNAYEKESKLLKKKKHQRIQDQNRTRALNQAFCKLRTCLPEIPKDTKLTKIRTLRYAISYIKDLMILAGNNDSPTSNSSHSFESQILIKNIQDCEDHLNSEVESIPMAGYY